jgi:hypothetical protein
MNKYPKKHLLPPEAGPMPQGLNLNYNGVRTLKQSGEKINVRKIRQHNKSSTKRA